MMDAKLLVLLQEKKSKYSTKKLAQCLADIRNGKLSQRRAAQVYGIPRTTICDKLNGKSPPVVCAKGPEPSLGKYTVCFVLIIEGIFNIPAYLFCRTR